MRYLVDFFSPIETGTNYAILGYDPKILLANQFARYFTFGLLDLLNLIPGVHCYVVHVLYLFSIFGTRN